MDRDGLCKALSWPVDNTYVCTEYVSSSLLVKILAYNHYLVSLSYSSNTPLFGTAAADRTRYANVANANPSENQNHVRCCAISGDKAALSKILVRNMQKKEKKKEKNTFPQFSTQAAAR